jgi:hypothetical protein
MGEYYPDIENVLIDWVESHFPAFAVDEDGVRHVDTETPEDLWGALPFVRVSLLAGRDDGLTDYSVVDLDVFADSRDTAYAFSRDLRSRLTAGPHVVGSAVIDRVRTEEKPRSLPWEDESVWRFGAVYRVSARR